MAQHTFPTPDPVELVVKIPSGDVEVVTVEGGESTVLVDGPDRIVEQTHVELVGNRLVVEVRSKGPFGIISSLRDLGQHVHIRARVPACSTAELTTAAAELRLRGRFAALSAKSASGALTVDGEIEGDTEIKTVSGEARLHTVGGDLRVQSVSGGVSALSVAGDVIVKSVSGSVRIASVHKGTFNAQSVSGDIELGVPAGTNLDVDAGSASGELSSEVPLARDAGVLGGGPRLIVRANTVSGDVRVLRSA